MPHNSQNTMEENNNNLISEKCRYFPKTSNEKISSVQPKQVNLPIDKLMDSANPLGSVSSDSIGCIRSRRCVMSGQGRGTCSSRGLQRSGGVFVRVGGRVTRCVNRGRKEALASVAS